MGPVNCVDARRPESQFCLIRHGICSDSLISVGAFNVEIIFGAALGGESRCEGFGLARPES